jgi:hypothetical protein
MQVIGVALVATPDLLAVVNHCNRQCQLDLTWLQTAYLGELTVRKGNRLPIPPAKANGRIYLGISIRLFVLPRDTDGSNSTVHKETAHSTDLQLEWPSASALD